ncbi:unnamed protein product [Didymodactylos carnosus]|uniref:adenine phosphoribosyltransferase n=1 Tax=Didymodactylos carnosus TaxID=1234261 RepID=A0A815XYT1_9BILA|nr:unnamed protein product [Didymodactylos carnosus]CAF1563802.1 unnamed protein product [Didymodactylos carnosus]CAF4231240.1 unnamed protein product [Didymodactylos carnosus]CAF4425571.1 unnamed protein product [Didymodactylos carnosus]
MCSDILGIFINPEAHRALIDVLIARIKKYGDKVNAIAACEARGFIFGPQIALELKLPFIPVRKHGKLPGPVCVTEYELEYGNDTVEIQKNVLKPGNKVILLDDLLATGGTLSAAKRLIEQIGCEVLEIFVVIELLGLKGRERLNGNVSSLMHFSEQDLEELAKNITS